MRAEEHGDAGMSLVEVLLAVAIMGITTTAVLGALGTQIRGTALHRDQSNAAVVLTSAAERVKAASYALCSPTSYLTAARASTVPSDWVNRGWTTTNAINLTVAYWNGTSFTSTCKDNEANDSAGLFRLQRITISAAGPDGGLESVDVVKAGQAP